MKLRVATLNAWALPRPFGEAVPQRMHAIGLEIAQVAPDVIAFQEAWTQATRRELARLGRDAGLVHSWAGDDGMGASGLLLLSRWPLGNPRLQRFSLPQLPPRFDHADYYASKGFIDVTLETPAGSVRLVTTHLQARYGRHVSHEYRSVRVGQVIELAMALDRVQQPVVLLGDLNFNDSDDEYRVFTGLTQLRDAAAEIGGRVPTVEPTNPFRGPSSRLKRIDYVFVRDGGADGVRVNSIDRVFDQEFEIDGQRVTFSDHAGLVAEVELHGSPDPLAPPTKAAADLAEAMLAEGRARAERQRADARITAGAGWAAALVATLGGRHRTVSRRRLLRVGLTVAGLAALPSGVGYTVMAEVFAPDELDAYDRLSARLAAVAKPTRLRLT